MGSLNCLCALSALAATAPLTLLAALIYILGTPVVMGVIPLETLAKSSAPFADAASAMWGDWAAIVISLAAIISSLGAPNGWTLKLSQVPMPAAQHGAMPASFARVSSRGVPAQGLVISIGLAILLVLIEISGSYAGAGFCNSLLRSRPMPRRSRMFSVRSSRWSSS